MRFFTEFVVLHEDGPMPEAETLCPSFWAGEDFDSDGDFYANGIAGRWTHLELTRRESGQFRSQLVVRTYYANNRLYEPAHLETHDLKRYIDYKDQGRFDGVPRVGAIQSPAVTSLSLETIALDDYGEFLGTVHAFLQRANGVLVNVRDLDAAGFRLEFLAGSS
jgi:hypothetical protein